jgi:hypothetical protein
MGGSSPPDICVYMVMIITQVYGESSKANYFGVGVGIGVGIEKVSFDPDSDSDPDPDPIHLREGHNPDCVQSGIQFSRLSNHS